MATGNIKVKNARCKHCNNLVKAERNGMIWGLGDFIMVLLTLGLWAVLRWVSNALSNPWRCSKCGKRVG
jgi:hypothetical protein